MERNNGFINIENCKVIRECNTKRDGKNCVAWLQYENQEVLFKAGTEMDSISEVFWSYVLNHLKKKNVGYDLAKYNGCYGVMTKNYNSDKKEAFSLYEIIASYFNYLNSISYFKHEFDRYNVKNANDIYNLKAAKSAILYKFKDEHNIPTLEKINQELIELFILQILLGSKDMHGHNAEIWIPNNTPELAPYYDFGKYGELKLTSIIDYVLDYEYQYEDEFEKANPVFQNFLQNASIEELETYQIYMEKIKQIKVAEIFEEMEENIRRTLPWRTKRNLTRRLYRNAKASNKYFKN